MATRLYPWHYGTADAPGDSHQVEAPIAPSSWSAGWNKTSQAANTGVQTARLGRAKPQTASPIGVGEHANSGTGVADQYTAVARFVSEPLAAQTISGNLKGQFKCVQALDSNYTLAVAVKVIQPSGADRGVVLAVSSSEDISSTPPEMALSTATNRKLMNSTGEVSLPLSSLAVTAGDRLVVEIGFWQQGTAGASARIEIGGSPSFSDLPEDNTTTGDGNPWVEFDTDVAFLTDITYVGSRSNPTDAAAASLANDPTGIGTPDGMVAGDLVLLIGHQRAASATIVVSNNGGQSWTAETAITTTNVTARLFWCIFDGTWDANPSVDFSAAVCNSVQMHVFRALNGGTWAINQALTELDIAAAATQTITGQTTTGSNDTVTVAGWFTADDNTWGSISGTGWENLGGEQYRNVAGSDQSSTYAMKFQAAAGATGNVSKTQLTNGNDAATSFIITFDITVAGSQTVEVPVGSLTAAASAPTAHKDDIVAIGAGALTFTGLVPLSVIGTNLPVPLGSLTFNGFAPSLGRGVPVPLGQLTANGFAPTTEIDVVSAVPAGTLTATAFAPVPIVAQVIIVPAGSLTLNGFAPTMEIDVVAAVPAGALTATGFAPTNEFDIVVVVPAGSLSLTGFAPSSLVSFVVSVPAGVLSANSFAPSIEIDVLISVPVGALTANGFAPTTEIDVVIVIPAGSLTAAADPPSIFVATIAAVPAGSLTASGFAPTMEIDVVAAVPVGTLTLTGLSPSLSEDQFAQPPAGELTLTGFAPSADIDVLASPGVGTLLMTGHAPTADIDVLVMTLTGTLIADGPAPEALISGAIEIPRGQLTAVGHQPSALLASLISVPAGNLSLTGLVAAVLRIINPKPSPSRTLHQGNTSRTVHAGGARMAKTTGLREVDT